MRTERVRGVAHYRITTELGQQRLIPPWMFEPQTFAASPVQHPIIDAAALLDLQTLVLSTLSSLSTHYGDDQEEKNMNQLRLFPRQEASPRHYRTRFSTRLVNCSPKCCWSLSTPAFSWLSFPVSPSEVGPIRMGFFMHAKLTIPMELPYAIIERFRVNRETYFCRGNLSCVVRQTNSTAAVLPTNLGVIMHRIGLALSGGGFGRLSII